MFATRVETILQAEVKGYFEDVVAQPEHEEKEEDWARAAGRIVVAAASREHRR
jgi:hypothetical protein